VIRTHSATASHWKISAGAQVSRDGALPAALAVVAQAAPSTAAPSTLPMADIIGISSHPDR
jgi:hypothetical protein